MLGYYEIETMQGNVVVSQGLGDDLKVKLGRIRDYELSGHGSLALGVSSLTLLATALLL